VRDVTEQVEGSEASCGQRRRLVIWRVTAVRENGARHVRVEYMNRRWAMMRKSADGFLKRVVALQSKKKRMTFEGRGEREKSGVVGKETGFRGRGKESKSKIG
jgi:hypothetical protein